MTTTTQGAADPVTKNQSKYADARGVLRYVADGSEVFPGATGVRTFPVDSKYIDPERAA